jgi:multidrug efflux system membrane fusion protein
LASGYLTSIDNQIDQTTGTAKLKAEFSNEDDMLWPNQFVNIQMTLENRPNTTVIPAAAVQRGPDGTFVYAVKQDSTVQMEPVTVALTQNNTAAISQGVQPGDVVVTDGQDKLQSGMKIEARAGGQHNGSPNSAGQNSAAASPGGQPDSNSPAHNGQNPSAGTVGQPGSNNAINTAPSTQGGKDQRRRPAQGNGSR